MSFWAGLLWPRRGTEVDVRSDCNKVASNNEKCGRILRRIDRISDYNPSYSHIYPTRYNVTQFIYTWKQLYKYWMVTPSISRSAYNCI
jgi:hypothetical protein